MTTERRSVFPLVVHTIVRNTQGELLLLERMNTGYKDGCYSLPGGHVEAGESVSRAAIREVFEETQIVIEHVCPRVVMPFQDGVDFIFEASCWEGVPKVGEPESCARVGWFDQDSLPPNVVSFVPKALDLIESGVWFSEFQE